MIETPSPHAQLDLVDETATEALAARLSAMCGRGDMISLKGDLGMGKTVFARAFIRSRTSPDEEVPSPTFTLLQVYDTTSEAVYHFDLYRLKTADEILELGFEDALDDGVGLVEWPDRLGPYLPRDRLEVELIKGKSEHSRRARLTGYGYWQARMTDAFLEGKIHA
jgi:tRNA threonylcarbamoyladenosine biosynthesis protein TsaE